MAYKFTLKLSNCTANVNETTEYNEGQVVEIVLTAGSVAAFPTSTYQRPYLTYFDSDMWETVKKYFTVSDDGKTATYTLTMTGDTTITANAEVDGVVFDLTEVDFATCNVNESTVVQVGQVVELAVTANSGYYFGQVPYIGYWSMAGEWKTIAFETADTGEYKSNYTLALTVPESQSNELSIHAVADVTPKVDKYGIITIYNPTSAELKAIGDVRYQVLAGDGSAVVDLGAFISNILKVYVNLPECNKANVKLGGYNTEVSANVVLDDIVETDCGTIEIVGKYGNIMDYEHTTVEIYLPFIGFQKLDTNKVMNEVLSLTYKTNILNGDSIACIYNTTGTLLYTFNCNVSFEIPYMMGEVYDDRSSLKVDSNYLFGFTPFVTIRTNKQYNSALVTAADNRFAKVADLEGLITCSQVFNTIKATTEEKEAIDNLLKAGVII